MKYPVALMPTEEGYSVSCPGLPGCWSQGATEDEALANIQDAIREYVEVAKQLAGQQNLREVEMPAERVPKIPGIPHLRAVRALEKVGFHVARQGKHIVMTGGMRIVAIPEACAPWTRSRWVVLPRMPALPRCSPT